MRPAQRPTFIQRGFTLLEMVLVIVIIGILGRILTPVVLGSLRANAAILDIGVTLDKARLASERLAFEIRELASGSISTASVASLVFSRVDYGISTTPMRTVTIDQTSPTVIITGGVSRNQCDASVRLTYAGVTPGYTPVLTDQVCSLVFSYFDQTGVATTVPANIRYVDFTLTLQPNAAGQAYAQRTRVALRNH